MVRLMRFERTRVAPLPPEDSVSAISPQPHLSRSKSERLIRLTFLREIGKSFFVLFERIALITGIKQNIISLMKEFTVKDVQE